MGWKGESRRHSLSRKGIKTVNPCIIAKGKLKGVSFQNSLSNKGELIIQAVDQNGNIIGQGYFTDSGEHIKISAGSILWVEPEWRRKGIAKNIIETAKEITGKKVLPSYVLTPSGRLFQKGVGLDSNIGGGD